jgi:hypothetical protein
MNSGMDRASKLGQKIRLWRVEIAAILKFEFATTPRNGSGDGPSSKYFVPARQNRAPFWV